MNSNDTDQKPSQTDDQAQDDAASKAKMELEAALAAEQGQAELPDIEIKPLEFETEFTEYDLSCRKCQGTWQAVVARRVHLGTDPDAKLGLLLDTMHYSRCPACKWQTLVETTFELYDPEEKLIVQVRPKWEYKAGGGEKWYLARFEDLVMKYAENDVRVDVVFGRDELVDKYLGGEEAAAVAQKDWDERKAIAREEYDRDTAERKAQREERERQNAARSEAESDDKA